MGWLIMPIKSGFKRWRLRLPFRFPWPCLISTICLSSDALKKLRVRGGTWRSWESFQNLRPKRAIWSSTGISNRRRWMPAWIGATGRAPISRSISRTEGVHTGKHCLRIDFTVSRNEEYMPVYQFVPVVSNQAYLLTAYVRSQDITSDSGPRLQVLGKVPPRGPNGVSETTVGTTPWHPISLKFCTGPDTKLVELSVIRVRGRTFPTEITGSFWLDNVVLRHWGRRLRVLCTASVH